MPRLATPRPPAAPSTPPQQERQARVLRVAARLGAERGLDGLQMADVAREAGVALGTLYRYYPSKHHLFAGVLAGQVAALPVPAPRPGDPAGAVADLLARACHGLLVRPLLARALMTSVNAVRAETGATGETTMRDLVVAAAGLADPAPEDLRLARLVEQCAYGVLTWAVAGECSPAEAEEDVRRACMLLLAPWSLTDRGAAS